MSTELPEPSADNDAHHGPSEAVVDDAATGEGVAVRKKRRKGTPSKWELPILVALAIAIAVILKTFVIQPFYIPSASMQQTLYGCQGCHGDRILVFKPVYHLRDPKPGDIAVFRAPQMWPEDTGGTVLAANPVLHALQWAGQLVGVVPPSEKDLVKRVIAVGGQTVRCCDTTGRVEVSDDGKSFRPLVEPYLYEDDHLSFGPVLVPAGRLWVLGDHRGDSSDSRYHCDQTDSQTDAVTRAGCDPVRSTVPVDDVIGKAVVIAWPISRWRTLGTPATFSGLAAPPGVGHVGALVSAVTLLPIGWRRLRAGRVRAGRVRASRRRAGRRRAGRAGAGHFLARRPRSGRSGWRSRRWRSRSRS